MTVYINPSKFGVLPGSVGPMCKSETRRHYRTRKDTRMPRWVTVETAAEYLSVHPRTVRRRISEDAFPASKVGPRDIRVDLDDVDAWLAGNRIEESA